MSNQDSQVCVKCGKLCGHDNGKGSWPGQNKAICGQCKHNLGKRFNAFFGIDNAAWDDMGLEIEWPDVDKILSRIKRDYAMRVSYLVTDKEFYEKIIDITKSVEQG